MNPVLGRYVPGDSFVHRLDPRCKMLCLLLLTSSILLADTIFEYVIPLAVLIPAMVASRVNLKTYLKGINTILFLLVFAAAIQFFYEGVQGAIYIFLRLFLILLAAEVFTFTTQPSIVAFAIEDILRVFGIPKVKAQEFSMIMSIALRFAPIMVEEAQRIMRAQISRGAPIDSGKIFERIKALSAVVIPLMASAIRKAEELSLAMEARMYVPGKVRSRYREMVWRKKDTAALFFAAASLILAILI